MEHRGISFTAVQTISKGWRWSVDQGEREAPVPRRIETLRSVGLKGTLMIY
jgi:hypothetical protein